MKTSTRRLIWWVLGASLALTACGCWVLGASLSLTAFGFSSEGLEVEKQTVFVKLDERNESITILVTHEGFSVETGAFEKKETTLAKAKEKLAAFTTSDRAVWLFLFFDFLDPVEIDPKQGETKDVLWIKRKLSKFIEVEHGASCSIIKANSADIRRSRSLAPKTSRRCSTR